MVLVLCQLRPPCFHENNAAPCLIRAPWCYRRHRNGGFSRPAKGGGKAVLEQVKGDLESLSEEFVRSFHLSAMSAGPLFRSAKSCRHYSRAGVLWPSHKGHFIQRNRPALNRLSFGDSEFTPTMPHPPILPSYTMIAAYHHNLCPDPRPESSSAPAIEVEQQHRTNMLSIG